MKFKFNNKSYKTIISKNKSFSGTTLEGWILTAQDYNDQEIIDSLIKARFIEESK